jgi:hypothetical protein
MTVNSFFHNSVGGDRIYEANDFATHTSTIISDGVIEGLKVTYTNAYAYTIDIGKAIVLGRSVYNDAVIATSIGTPVSGELHSVVVRMDLATRSATIETILGTTYQDDNAIKQIPLATILVGTNTLTITDKRVFASFKSGNMLLKNSELKFDDQATGAEFPAIKFRSGTNTGGGISIGVGGTTVIGGGESPHDVIKTTQIVSDTSLEKLILASDYDIQVLTGMQDVVNTPTTGKRAVFATNGDFQIGGNNADANIGVLRFNATTKVLEILHWNGSVTTTNTVLSVGDLTFKNVPWTSLTLASGISDYTTNTNVEYQKKGGVVYLRGAVKGITAINKIIGTLPVGFRPTAQTHNYAMPTSLKNFARWAINTDGTIVLENVSQTAAPASDDWFPIHTCFSVD